MKTVTNFKLSFFLMLSFLVLGTTKSNAQCPGFDVSPDVTICEGESTTLTANGGILYNWGPAAGLSATNGATVTASPTTTTTYTVTGTTLFLCVESKMVTVTVVPSPTVTVTGTTEICEGEATVLTAAGATNYTWGPADGLDVTTGATVNASPTEATTYVVTGTNGGACDDSEAITVIVNPAPELVIVGDTEFCEGDSTILTANGADTYAWIPATGLSSTTDASVIANPKTTTTYTITGTSTKGCTTTETITVTVNPIPVITITGDSAICEGEATTLTAAGATAYIWGPATALNTTVGETIIASPAVTTTFTVTGRDTLTGCAGSQTVTVTVDTLPTVTASGNMLICAGDSTVITAAGADNFTWGFAPGLSDTTATTVTASPATTTTYTVTGITTAGCNGTATFTIAVSELPVITVAGLNTICQGDSTLLTANGAATYSWSPAVGLSSPDSSFVMAGPDSTTLYTVTGTNTAGCTSSTTVTVNVVPVPTITITGDTSICFEETTILTATSNRANDFLWGPTTALNTTIGDSILASPAVTTTFTVVGTDTVTGCTARGTITVIVNPAPEIIISGDSLICFGESSVLTANGGNNLTWDPGASLDTTAGTTVIASPEVTTTYIVTGTSNEGCIGAVAYTVFVSPQPEVVVAGLNVICEGDSTILTAAGADSFVWSPGASLNSTTDATVIASPSTTTAYTIIGTNAAGCSDTTDYTVTANALPILTITPDATICNGSAVTLMAAGAQAYEWVSSSAIGFMSTNVGENVLVIPFETTTYTVFAENEAGCIATAEVTITIDCNNVSNAYAAVGIEDNTADSNGGTIFPNPTAGIINIVPFNSNEATTITITNNAGQIVFETTSNTNTVVDLSQQAAGIYTARITSGSTTIFKKIVKQ